MFHKRLSSMGLLALTLLPAAWAGGVASHRVGAAPGGLQTTSPPTLTEPGNDIFGAIQEVIRRLDADPRTDWSNVHLEALRQHLLDMQAFTDDVRLIAEQPIPGGVRLVVQPTTPRAATALRHVLSMHPMELEREAGWTMRVGHQGESSILTVTTHKPAEAAKIRALGYIGLMAYGGHHRRHHWMIATGRMTWPPAPRHDTMP